MTTVLRDAPPLRVHGPGRAALAWNLAGTLSAAVTVHGVTQPWIMDTGAQISTLPQSTAAAMGVRLLPGAIEVGTSTPADPGPGRDHRSPGDRRGHRRKRPGLGPP